MVLRFSVAPGTDFRTLDLNKLRFWLGNDDNYTRDQLYLWFCEYLQGADLTVGEQHIRLPEFMLKAVGFEPQDAMLPWPKNVHSGYLDMLPEGDPRDQFHRQYLAAQLTEEAGLVQLAQQQYRMLFRMGLQMMVADWEPSLLEQLEQKFTAEQ